MRTAVIVLFSIFCVMETFAQVEITDRQPVAAGKFYPADKVALTGQLSELFKSCRKSSSGYIVRAIICPHAGYVFSGKIAAEAFSAIPENSVYKNIFIIGSSHVMSFDGASVYNTGDFVTPMGKVTVNRELANILISTNKVFSFPVTAHAREHSIEVQLPFIQYYFKNIPPIVPVIIGTQNESTVKKIAEALKPYFRPDNLFIISSDFSHYPSYADANRIDSLTAVSIESDNPATFLNRLKNNDAEQVPGLATSMCGWTSGLTLLFMTQGDRQLKIKHIDYCNSGDSQYGNKLEVVGYHAFAITDRRQKVGNADNTASDFSFSQAEKEQLFKIAKSSISSRFSGKESSVTDDKKIPENLRRQYGAFVTLKINGVLRGCIGRFISTDPLYKVVEASALSSAFEDPRFPPLTRDEFEKTEFEITVLGPLKKINDISEIVLGKHGIYIKKELRSGTMLPQVATENKWTVEQFLGYTSRDKAGIGWDGWKNAEIFIYEGMVLKDNKR